MSVSTKRKLSTPDRPCNDESSYSFHKCIESYLYRKRGCQFPWNYYEDLHDVPVCESYAENIDSLNKSAHVSSLGAFRDYWTNFQRTLNTNGDCPQPCNVTSYKLKYEVNDASGEGHNLSIAFKNFVFQHSDEFRSCDFTCFIGELGGNIGFFLGGSLLSIIEYLLIYVVPKLKMVTMRCDKK